MDNQWLATPKQMLGVVTSRFYLHPCFDLVFLPGSRQRRFANYLGFEDDLISTGFYSADVSLFESIRARADAGGRRSFLFTGRLVAEKGVDVLARAYASYRESTDDPWDLIVAGSGPLDTELAGLAGVRMLGFVQPGRLPPLFEQAGALVLPSRFEPWGVVVHEATCAGLPVVTTDRAGAADDLVVHRTNGFVAKAGATDDLLEGLRWAHELDADDRAAASVASVEHAALFSPERWADAVIAMAGVSR